MVLNRRVDERMIMLQRQGRIGFYIGSIGEEAAIIGSAYALRPGDWIVPCYREAGAAFLRGVPLLKFICQLFGNAGDPNKGRQMPNHLADRERRFLSISSPVGTQIPQAAGVAWAAKIRGDDAAVLVYFGDGATSEGDFHVGLNFAGVFKLPVVFLCRNNQWAISVPREKQTASASIAIKAAAYGLESVRVDGNDLLAVVEACRRAVDRAHAGGGATLVEAVTYRQGAHSTSDDPRGYRADKEVEEWKRRDPIDRFLLYLQKAELWDEAHEAALQEEVQAHIVATVRDAETLPPPALHNLFEEVYATMPWHLREQQEEVLSSHR
jgi:2-oxoisovalerate dehydrogenase E1 component alpha subunit